jgi:serine/threonine protein phosphatase 1
MVTVPEADGERIFVIGDIHGCYSELKSMLEYLSRKLDLSDKDLVVFLGDYIDRGPDSRGVLDALVDFKTRFPNCIFLKGNHEDMLLDFLGFGGNLGHAFLYNGGLETIQSYGISVFSPPNEMMRLLPEDHFSFFNSLESVVTVRDYYLVHAGLNPSMSLEKQTGEDLFWIRESFLDAPHEFGKTIIFGHTPHREIFDNRPFKIGLDTGLVFGNKLSCLELVSGKVYEVARGASEVMEGVMQPV